MMLSDANFFDLNEEQIKLFKQIYDQDQRPNVSIMQQLVEATGLNLKIVSAWFKNERKKERKRLMEERRRQEKERKKLQRKQKKEKTPKENSSSSDSSESDSTITSGDCLSSSSNSSEESSDADDNNNIKNPSITTPELTYKHPEQNVCSTSQQQQQTNYKPQQYKKNKWGLNMFFLLFCICVFLALNIIYILKNSNSFYKTQEQEITSFYGSHNNYSILLSAALNDWLFNEKQKSVITLQTIINRSEDDYKIMEKNNGTKGQERLILIR
ncbi:hypothetical protein Mgra_00005849 [Meloidogyne graminicola]|uniref:Homeobox domain-containing protein n=1 Tax=Meloidogyne graminicola TaxID=189291 RepID=A0A8S9ZN23_9BILA|nr:hypothetical protein Mgra_00005849 [Meloidogyne graminicola]KAF7634701.1 hypothetical protein Mgra_00005849 [Meloidogyne graminicola]